MTGESVGYMLFQGMVKSPRHSLVFTGGSFVCSALAFFLFMALSWSAAADAQGAIVLFLYSPLLVVLLVGAYFLSRRAAKFSASAKTAKWTSLTLSSFFLLFYLSPFVGTRVVSNNTIGLIGRMFKAFTGKTPYEWEHGGH